MKRGWLVGGSIIGALVIAGGWFAFSPYWTISRMHEAIANKDSRALSEHIDFEALRADIKEDISRRMADEMRRDGAADSGSMMMMGIAMRFAEEAVDGLISPEGINLMMALSDLAPKDRGQKKPRLLPGFPKRDDMVIAREGLNSFRIYRRGAVEDGVMIFRRRGLGWKLAAVNLGADLGADMGVDRGADMDGTVTR